jgi:hypothetical protein
MKTYKTTFTVADATGYIHEYDFGFIKAENHTSALAWIISKFGAGENGAFWSVKAVA